ncbi:30S ribosomal protein S12 methylthiotransferase RimO [Clostridiales bacterium COT073_COT-073]|nr:30S ribosomal protein S12 methylthiotransferase RimO [Clostridiales bacterium COT073_COT-073]
MYVESLGCDKNLVDTEVMLGRLVKRGCKIVLSPEQADIAIINTCSFIHDAKTESIEAILELAAEKNAGRLPKIIVTGCLSELYQEQIRREIPEVDGVLGATNTDKIEEVVADIMQGRTREIFDGPDYDAEVFVDRISESGKYYAFLKIAEGCDNHCTYCIIPKLRGKFRSRTMESLVEEAKYLVRQGKREIILVAQDVGKYGLDLYGRRALPELLEKLAAVEGIDWLRLLYVYPEDVTDELITAIKKGLALPYLDMPLQHADDIVLKKMARKSKVEDLRKLLAKLRSEIPEICLRTTFITGFPGESEENFENLHQFLKEAQFDRVGVFTYSKEENTPAARMKEQIPARIKKQRQKTLMLTQQQIAFAKNESLVGRQFRVMIDAYLPQDNVYIGRTYRDTPDVDGYVFVESKRELLSGDMIDVKIVGVNEYDLIGEEIYEFSE